MNKLPFTECVRIVGTAAPSFDGVKKYVSTGALDCDHIDYSQVEEITYDNRPSRANLTARAGDILFAKMQGTKKTIMLDTETEQHIYSTGFCAIRAKTDVINSRCLYHLVSSTDFLLQKDRNCSGATQKAITNSGFQKIIISIPDIVEQPKIADCLDLIDHAIAIYYQIIELLDQFVKSRFVEMFGDPEINDKRWKECPLSEKLNVLGGYAFRSELFNENNGVPVLRIGNINSGFFRPINMVYWEEDENLSRYFVFPGDLVISLTGTVGKDDYANVCILGDEYEKYYLNQRNAKLELKEELDKYYLSQLLKFDCIKKRLTGISRGVRQANISNKDILNLIVPIPPMGMQNSFAAFVNQTNKSKATVQKALQEIQTLYNSLMQQYFG